MKKRILLIDDDHLLNRINEKVLLAAGFVSELHVVLNGRQALDYLLNRALKCYPLPDLIILDLHMPVMDGFAFLDEFQKLDFAGKSAVEVVVFTASSSPKDIQKVQAYGIHHYISKPYLLRGLTGIIGSTENKSAKLSFSRSIRDGNK